MISRTEHSECLQYSPYLYDYLCNNRDDIPEFALKHISQCARCADEIDALESELKVCDSSTDSAGQAARLVNLELHFAYMGKDVGCSEAKTFLATMVSNSLSVKIPTPITAHVDSCIACSNDMKTLHDMALPEKQLFRVGCVLAGFTLKKSGEVDISKEIIYAMAGIEYEKSQIDKLAMIAKRPESGIRTRYSVKGKNAVQAEPAGGQVYEDWQIDVKVLHDHDIEKCGVNAQGRVKKLRFRRFVKPFAAAAAVLMAVLILFNGPDAMAGLERVYKSLAQVRNVCLKTVSVISGNVTQEIWISKDLNMKIGTDGSKTYLWDIASERLITREDSDSVANISRLEPVSLSYVSKTMESPWSLLPFNSMSDLLAIGAEWQVLTRTEAGDVPPGIDVYEVLWTESSSSGNVTSWKWRGYIDSKMSLPKRVEQWSKSTGGTEYQLETVIEISYPDTEQIQSIVDEIQR